MKALTDADHGKVSSQSKKTTVSWLVAQDPPSDLPENGRVAPIETQTYQVEATLVGFKREKDRDFHIVIADTEDSQQSMIVEIPDPKCEAVCSSPILQEIEKARQDFINHCGEPTTGFRRLQRRLLVTVIGVGFFDFLHGQTGVADNGIELHPVRKIEFPTDTNDCELFARRGRAH